MYETISHTPTNNTAEKPRPFGFEFVGVLDCRTPAERQADERNGKTWQAIEWEARQEVRGMIRRLRRPAR